MIGKIAGGLVGFMLGGPVGAALGAGLGHAVADQKNPTSNYCPEPDAHNDDWPETNSMDDFHDIDCE